jgi:endonuclease YncB( thermonuclease family)
MFRPVLLSLALLCASCAPGGPLALPDGDTFTARMDGNAVKIRLRGIDAPEKGQAFGDASKWALSGLSFERSVWIQKTDLDRWGRTVAEVWTSSGKRVGPAMVEAGQAWHFVKYAPADSALDVSPDLVT